MANLVLSNFQTNSLAISLVGGRIVLSMRPEAQDGGDGEVKHIRSDTSTYNDGRWHYITVTKRNRE